MPQPHPSLHLPRQAQNIPQRPDLQPIQIPIHRVLHERLELQRPLFNLEPLLALDAICIFVFGFGGGAWTLGEAEDGGVRC